MPSNHVPRSRQNSLVTVSHAAEMIGVAPKTLRRWIDQQKVPAYRVGEFSIRVDRDEVLALVKPVHTLPGGAE